jgi:hypothetical protein
VDAEAKRLAGRRKITGMVPVEHGKGNPGIHVLERVDIHDSLRGFDASSRLLLLM